jgi:hypothetical protein
MSGLWPLNRQLEMRWRIEVRAVRASRLRRCWKSGACNGVGRRELRARHLSALALWRLGHTNYGAEHLLIAFPIRINEESAIAIAPPEANFHRSKNWPQRPSVGRKR